MLFTPLWRVDEIILPMREEGELIIIEGLTVGEQLHQIADVCIKLRVIFLHSGINIYLLEAILLNLLRFTDDTVDMVDGKAIMKNVKLGYEDDDNLCHILELDAFRGPTGSDDCRIISDPSLMVIIICLLDFHIDVSSIGEKAKTVEPHGAPLEVHDGILGGDGNDGYRFSKDCGISSWQTLMSSQIFWNMISSMGTRDKTVLMVCWEYG